MSTRKQNAFTLVEMLVVITVVALLVSLFLPVISRAREVAQAGICMSNLRQNMVGSLSYSADSKEAILARCQYPGYVMTGFTYMLDTGCYWTRQTFMCPTTPALYQWQYNAQCTPWSKLAGPANANYAYANFWGSNPNSDHNNPTGTYYYLAGAINNQSNAVQHYPWNDFYNDGTNVTPLFTMTTTMVIKPDSYAYFWDQDTYRQINTTPVTTRTHSVNPGRSFAFADGHVRFISEQDQAFSNCTAAPSMWKGVEDITPIITASYQVVYYSPQYGPIYGHGTGYQYNGYCGQPISNQAASGILNLSNPF